MVEPRIEELPLFPISCPACVRPCLSGLQLGPCGAEAEAAHLPTQVWVGRFRLKRNFKEKVSDEENENRMGRKDRVP